MLSKVSGDPLNKFLEKIPLKLTEPASVSVRFYLNKVALIVDIEKSFLYVAVQEKYQDALGFY